MVLCDGLGCDGFVWKYLLPELRERYQVLRWHYRGHGRSGLPHDRERVGMLYTCEDLDRILAHVGMERAVIFGHSMGVQVALEFQRRFAHRCLGLALICGSYGNVLDTFHDDTLLKRAFPAIRALVERFPRPAALLTRLALSSDLAVRLAFATEVNGELMRKQDLVPYFDHLSRMDPVIFTRSLESLAEHTAWDHLPHVDVPTLIVGGERDKFTPLWLSRRMGEAIPGAELIMVPGGTHLIPLEHPSLIAERVHRFIEQRVLPRTAARPEPEQERRAG